MDLVLDRSETEKGRVHTDRFVHCSLYPYNTEYVCTKHVRSMYNTVNKCKNVCMHQGPRDTHLCTLYSSSFHVCS